jgi:hypothetical protein
MEANLLSLFRCCLHRSTRRHVIPESTPELSQTMSNISNCMSLSYKLESRRESSISRNSNKKTLDAGRSHHPLVETKDSKVLELEVPLVIGDEAEEVASHADVVEEGRVHFVATGDNKFDREFALLREDFEYVSRQSHVPRVDLADVETNHIDYEVVELMRIMFDLEVLGDCLKHLRALGIFGPHFEHILDESL